MDKQQIKNALVSAMSEQVSDTRADEIVDEDAAQLDQNEPIEPGEQSQADQAGEMRGHVEAVAESQKAQIREVEALDVSPRTTIEPGAVAVIDGNAYLVGVVAAPFDVDGTTYEGMSTDAPLYEAAQGLEAGDSFTFLDREHHVDSVD